MLETMDQQIIIAVIVSRAKALGLTIGQVCNDAGVHPSTFSRWRKTKKNQNPMDAKLKSLAALDEAVKAHEREIA